VRLRLFLLQKLLGPLKFKEHEQLAKDRDATWLRQLNLTNSEFFFSLILVIILYYGFNVLPEKNTTLKIYISF